MPEHVGFYNFKQIDNDVNLMPLEVTSITRTYFVKIERKKNKLKGNLINEFLPA